MVTPDPQYRKVSEMRADELLAELTTTPRRQHDIFISLRGDPGDLNYARLSFLTKELRDAGHKIRSDKRLGIWLEPETD